VSRSDQGLVFVVCCVILGWAIGCHPSPGVKQAEQAGVDLACVVAAAEGATPAELEACKIARAVVSAQATASGSASAP